MHIQSPDAASLGEGCAYRDTIADADHRPIDAVIPLRVETTDPHERPAEFSGDDGAPAGELELALDLATYDAPGVWTMREQELASGRDAAHFLRLTAPRLFALS